jgi:signal transduction histidine kinase
LKQIVEAHDGTVEVQSENNYPYNGIPHGIFSCIVTLPIS